MAGRDVKAGGAYVEMRLQRDPMQRGMRQARRSLGRLRLSVAAVAGAFTAMGATAAFRAVAGGLASSVKAAGDLEEAVSKFNTVFGDRAGQARQWADELSASLGLARREVLDTLSGFQDLFVPLGIAGMEAEGLSKNLTQLAVDLASFNNLQTADVVRDLQAAMTGSSETMKKYGVIVNVAAVKQELLNQGLDPKAATEAEKAFARFNIIMRSTVAAQGDAARTADSYANQVRRLENGFTTLQEKVGEKILPLFTDFAQIANVAIQDLIEGIDKVIPQFDGLADSALLAAQSGKWELVGEVIGLQIELGLRKIVGDRFFGLAELLTRASSGLAGASVQGSVTSGGIARSAISPIPGAALDLAERVGLPGTTPGSVLVEQRLEEILQELQKQTDQGREAATDRSRGTVFGS